MAEGIDEVKEVLVALNEISALVIRLAKDGVQLSDAVALASELLTNDELKSSVVKAVDGISKLPAEIKDLDLAKIMELVSLEVGLVPKLVAQLKA